MDFNSLQRLFFCCLNKYWKWIKYYVVNIYTFKHRQHNWQKNSKQILCQALTMRPMTKMPDLNLFLEYKRNMTHWKKHQTANSCGNFYGVVPFTRIFLVFQAFIANWACISDSESQNMLWKKKIIGWSTGILQDFWLVTGTLRFLGCYLCCSSIILTLTKGIERHGDKEKCGFGKKNWYVWPETSFYKS